MGNHSAKKLIPIFAFLLGSLLGSGILWQVQQVRLTKKAHELAIATAISELRGQVSDLSFRIIELSAGYVKIREAYDRTPTPEAYAKGEELKYKLELLKDDYRVLEGNLASMEKRMPRELNLSFPSLPPPQLNRIRPLLQKHLGGAVSLLSNSAFSRLPPPSRRLRSTRRADPPGRWTLPQLMLALDEPEDFHG